MIQLQAEEKILLVCRRHWLIFLLAIFQFAVIMVVVLIAPIISKIFFPEIISDYDRLVFLIAALILEILWVIFFLIITDYYLDVWIITSHRIVFIELHGIFSRTVSSVNLRDIQDVSTKVHGILPTVLKFGDVRIQSAGTTGEFIFKQVPHPYRIKDSILAAREAFLRGKNSV